MKDLINDLGYVDVVCTGQRIKKFSKSVSALLFFEDPLTGEKYTSYFNLVIYGKDENGREKLKFAKNSKLIKLYRLVFGTDPKNQYYKPKQLLNHFENECIECFVKFEVVTACNGEAYNRVVDIQLMDPHYSEEWSATGTLLKRKN